MGSRPSREKLVATFRGVGTERVQRLCALIVRLEQEPGDSAAAADVSRELHTLKGEASLLGFDAIASVAHRTEDVWASVRAGAGPDNAWDLLLRGLDLCGALIGEAMADDVATAERQLFDDDVSAALAAVDLEGVPVTDAGGASSAGAAPESVEPRVGRDARMVRILAEDLDEVVSTVATLGGATSVLIREITSVAARSDVSPEIRRALRGCIERAREVGDRSDELDTLLRSVRLVPLSEILEELPRQVRDACRASDREARAEVQGGETGVDSAVLDVLRDVLVHIVRNAIDHGIEAPEERVSVGKPAEGTIRVTAMPRGGELELLVEDDGRGIDPKALRRAAVEAGISDAEIETIVQRDVAELAFRTGISTASAASQTSGRGVGLDAVRRRIARIGGSVGIESEAGVFSRVRLVVPVSLATSRLTVAEAGALTFGIPAVQVLAVAHTERAKVWVHHGDGVVPVVHWHSSATGVASGPVLVVRTPLGPLGISVDRVRGGAIEVLTTPVPKLLAGHDILAAVGLFGGDRVLPVLDVAKLPELRASEPSAAGVRRALTRRRVVVADDSPLTLTVLVELLEGMGCEVFAARDGREALEHVRHRSPDLVLTDLDMPNMNGTELLAAIREEPATHALPVIVLTSRASAEDLRRGLDAGANAYLTKSDFRYEQLSDLVDQLVGEDA